MQLHLIILILDQIWYCSWTKFVDRCQRYDTPNIPFFENKNPSSVIIHYNWENFVRELLSKISEISKEKF